MYHDFSPMSVRKAGTSVIRTTSASVRIATASSRPNSFEMRSAVRMKAAKTVPMMIAAATMTRPIAAMPCSTASPGLQPVDVLLADAAHEEDHVVHREPEEDRERDRRHERLDRPRPVEPGQAQQVALLDDERQHAEADERGEDRRDRRRQRDDDRAERHREHDERDADDVEQEERQPLHDPVGDVLERRGQAGDVGDRVAALRRRRDDVVAQPVDELPGRLVLRRRVGRHEDDRDGLLVVELRLARPRRRPGGPARRRRSAAAHPGRRSRRRRSGSGR